MNSPITSLLRCCLAAVLLLSLLVSGVHDLWAQDSLETSDIVLALDADTHSDDSTELDALLSWVSFAPTVLLVTSYSHQLARAVLPGCFSPPDRPPSESA